MPTPLSSRLSLTVAFVAALAVASASSFYGGTLFSPGGLHAGDSVTAAQGGVSSHAELGRDCASCHAGPFSGTTMQALCVQCHADIRSEQLDTTSLHGAFAQAVTCTSCHTEHLGPNANLTSFDGIGLEHARFGFPLDGAHARVECAQCHTSEGGKSDYSNVPSTCVGCHQKDDEHNGGFGQDCASCHSTSTWEGATFDHEIFPIDHGAERGRKNTCATCHSDSTDYTVYTCYNCHEHTPANIEREHRGEVRTQNLSDCVSCHKGGREHGDRRGGDDEGDFSSLPSASPSVAPALGNPHVLETYRRAWARRSSL